MSKPPEHFPLDPIGFYANMTGYLQGVLDSVARTISYLTPMESEADTETLYELSSYITQAKVKCDVEYRRYADSLPALRKQTDPSVQADSLALYGKASVPSPHQPTPEGK